MLTVDHVKLRRRAGVVEVVPLCGVDDARALEMAGDAIAVALEHEGEARAALEDALEELPTGSPSEVKLARALKKLTLDACAFDVDTALDPEAVRAAVFHASAQARAAGTFARPAVLESVAQAQGVDVDGVERALYADLEAAHAVRGLDVTDPAAFVVRHRLAELQAVLLRAVRLTVDVEASALELRTILRALKLHQLLFEIDDTVDAEPGAHTRGAGDGEPGRTRFVVEGPMAMFQQGTRYGLKLALLLPHVLACKRAIVDAEVRLKKAGPAEHFVLRHTRATSASAPVSMSETARTLLDDVNALAGRFRASEATEILRHPGAGVFIPDLRLEDQQTGEVVYVEILGFWSRAAVWKRVELVERGLPWRVVFCASDRLRVSEAALPDEAPSALVVWKGVLRAARVVEAAERIARTVR